MDDGLRAALEIRAELPDVGLLVLSQYVEERYVVELLADGAEGVGYLLKDRVADVERFFDAVRRVAERRLRARSRGRGAHARPARARRAAGRADTSRARGARADGRGADEPRHRRATWWSASAPSSVTSPRIFGKLGLTAGEGDHRRVLAVLAFLRG